MKRQKTSLWVLLLAFLLLFGRTANAKEAAAEENEVQITILSTSDIHGMVNNYDYAADSTTQNGLVKAAAVIREEREKDPDLLLADCGDTLQGNLISSYRSLTPHPGIRAMNLLQYDTWTIGNHEFDYEFDTLNNAIAASDAAVLGANIYKPDGKRFLAPYVIKEVKGVRVALFGLTSPYVPRWVSDPSKYDSMVFSDPMEETDKILKELDGKADVIIGTVHIGENGDSDRDGMNAIALKYADKIDALLIGHSHANVAKSLTQSGFTEGNSENSLLVMLEPGVHGENVGKCTLNLKKEQNVWTVTSRNASLISTADIEPDPFLVKEMNSLHKDSLSEASKVIGAVGADFYEELYLLPGIPNGLLKDHALADLINTVQLANSGADVSMAALFSPDANLTKGEFRFKDGVKIYKYDNTLYGVTVTGAQLKKIMEVQAGALYNTYRDGDVTISFDPDFRLYQYDMFAGVDYEINISKPTGSRIQNVTFRGAPLKDSQKLVLALNDFRWSSLVKGGLIDRDAVVYNSSHEAKIPAIRDMIADYVKEKGTIYPECDNNWSITGASLEDPQKDIIYRMVREGSLSVPSTKDGRDKNIASLNANDLRSQGVLPALHTVYRVKRGDTLNKIALRCGCTLKELIALNKLPNRDRIEIGQKLLLPA